MRRQVSRLPGLTVGVVMDRVWVLCFQSNQIDAYFGASCKIFGRDVLETLYEVNRTRHI
jgi:hypothetical protein